MHRTSPQENPTSAVANSKTSRHQRIDSGYSSDPLDSTLLAPPKPTLAPLDINRALSPPKYSPCPAPPMNTPLAHTLSGSPPSNGSSLSRRLSKSTSLLRRLTRRLSTERKKDEQQGISPAPLPPPATATRHSRAVSAPQPRYEMRAQEAPLRRRSTRREQPRIEAEEDQRYQVEWRERHAAAAGFFDTRQRIRPDVSAMPSSPPRIHSVHPSSLSTFAPRAPLVSTQDRSRRAGVCFEKDVKC
ncbi:hypothetical protein BCR35DRAFT_341248 [Leucosporidium creatinivorum]|uniref:Uncharacterized protein n=1 Tax=Leucosporidium creatinivorum TaxID=106004 RepID=A0A1Y2FD32_9BASI|nr:hypothetical protein BCR35DRAFT_341248 [Leucosporidium creatinivorum]